MSAAIMESEPRGTRKRPNRKTGKDRVQVLLKPHVRMCMTRLAKEEGFSSLGLFGRQLVLEALEARGYPANKMLAEWHEELSKAALEGTTHPFAR